MKFIGKVFIKLIMLGKSILLFSLIFRRIERFMPHIGPQMNVRGKRGVVSEVFKQIKLGHSAVSQL